VFVRAAVQGAPSKAVENVAGANVFFFSFFSFFCSQFFVVPFFSFFILFALTHSNFFFFQPDIDSKGSMFYVTFRGEEGLDWGGVYRETLARATADLFAPYFSLNIPCPNRVHGQADNADRFLPNPSFTNPSSLSQLEFVGKLMGVALRTKNYLEFQYAP
jgi:hypothetical protein